MVAEIVAAPQLLEWLPYPPLAKTQDYLDFYDSSIRPAENVAILAILLKAGEVQKSNAQTKQLETFKVTEGTFAGIVGFLNSEPAHSAVEIGHVMIFPRFQRTSVGSNLYNVCLRHLLDPLPQDLNMRRVVWQANASNTPSVNAAKRIGFQWEGLIRWQRVLPKGKKTTEDCEGLESKGLPTSDKSGRQLGPGRHTAQLSLCWDDWLNGGREKVEALLKR